jgi:hypothetical protein
MKKFVLILALISLSGSAHAVDVVITIPDDKFGNVRDALCARGNYETLIESKGGLIQNPESCNQFARRRIVEWVKEEIKHYNNTVEDAKSRITANTKTLDETNWQ